MLDRSGLEKIQIRNGLSQIGLQEAELRPFLGWVGYPDVGPRVIS